MGRGGYDLTDPSKQKSAMGDVVLKWEEKKRADRTQATLAAAAHDAEQKLIRNKKSRGIMAARRAEKEVFVKLES